MEERRLSVRKVLTIGVMAVFLPCFLCANELPFQETRNSRIYRSGPTDEEIQAERDYEVYKEQRSWDMLQNLFIELTIPLDKKASEEESQRPFQR